MPSQLHEALLMLFRYRPALAPELLREALHVELPEYTELRVDSENLNDLQPAEYRADMVILLLHGKPVLGIIVEIQLGKDEDKRFAWPAYVTNLRTRVRCPVCLLVITAEDSVAKWAGRPIDLGGGNRFTPFVVGPSGVPEITDEAQAQADPELAVLSAMAHGSDPDIHKSLPIAMAAITATAGLDAEQAALYLDFINQSLSEAARKALKAMNPAKYEYQSEFARHYFFKGKAEGNAEGETKGRLEVIQQFLTLRFGELPQSVMERLKSADAAQIEAIVRRTLRASTLDEVLDIG